MRVVLILVAVAAVLGAAYYFLYSTPTIEVVLATTDGQGTLTYLCLNEKGEAEAAGRAEAAHVFFQEQLAVVSEAAAKSMQEAKDMANAAGTVPDFTAIEEVRADLMAATVSVVQDLYGCAVSDPPAAE
ncbi:MAG: hypothetical protein NTX73_18685 [Rhodobacterales bacterium]|nr:hypothetical protein [Rhodobacterales bacterium]